NVLSMNFLSNCSLAKMDVEGCETLVLQGAVDILSTCQIPVWLFELSDAALKHQGSSASELLHVFASHGYEFFLLNQSGNQIEACADPRSRKAPNNIACCRPALLEETLFGS